MMKEEQAIRCQERAKDEEEKTKKKINLNS